MMPFPRGRVALAGCAALLLCACSAEEQSPSEPKDTTKGGAQTAPKAPPRTPVRERLDAAQLQARLAELGPYAQVIDLRRPDEIGGRTLPGAKVLTYEKDSFVKDFEAAGLDPNKPVFFY